MYFGDENVLFIHIPKCGGNTVMDYFNYREESNPRVHWTADHYINDNPSKFKQCFVFTFVRNIYQQIVSMYKYSKLNYEITNKLSFEEFVFSENQDANKLKHILKQKMYIYDKKLTNRTDYIGDINNAQHHLKKICTLIDKPFVETIPHSNRTRQDDYKSYLNDKTIDKIKQYYADDIEYFGYDPYDLTKIKNVGMVKHKACKFI